MSRQALGYVWPYHVEIGQTVGMNKNISHGLLKRLARILVGPAWGPGLRYPRPYPRGYCSLPEGLSRRHAQTSVGRSPPCI